MKKFIFICVYDSKFYYIYTKMFIFYFISEQCGKIHATVRKKNLIPHFKEKNVEGSPNIFEKILVALNDVSFRTTNHKYKINLMGSTNIFKVNAPEIPLQYFEFMSLVNILSSSKEEKLLGEIYYHLYDIIYS